MFKVFFKVIDKHLNINSDYCLMVLIMKKFKFLNSLLYPANIKMGKSLKTAKTVIN